ncbi:MAG: DegT/DnrJ/EryC1/StrS family aminotransferase [Sphaerochaetaceae bacterium]
MALIPFYKPTLRRKDMDAVLQTMVDERIGPGERKNEFLKQFCTAIDASSGIALRSYPDALRSALQMLELAPGAKIGVSVLSPSLYASVAKTLQLELLLGDIDGGNGCLSQDEALRLVQEGAQALVVHEPMGQIPLHADYRQLGIPVIEDISQSFGSLFENEKAGGYGDLVVCALEEDGVVSAAGGAVLASMKGEYRKALSALFGNIREYVELPDMNAALGSIQLSNVEDLLEKRREFYTLFSNALLKTEHKRYGIGNIDFKPNGYGFCVVLDSKAEDAIKFANKYQVSARKTFADTLAGGFSDRFDLYPNALPPYLRGISLPLYPFLKQSDTELLIKVISHLP